MQSNAPMPSPVILRADGLTKEFRGFYAVREVRLEVRRGTIHALIGPNGAGKTTCFNLLTKFLTPTHGQIFYDDAEITDKKPADVARLGMVRSFQISAVFGHLTVLENVRIALQRERGNSFDFWRSEKVLDAFDDRAMALLEDVGLAEFAAETAVNLPYGRKRALEIATTLALDPRMLLLDEPTAGMGHEDIARVAALIRKVGGRSHGADGRAQSRRRRRPVGHHHRARPRPRHRRRRLRVRIQRPLRCRSLHGGRSWLRRSPPPPGRKAGPPAISSSRWARLHAWYGELHILHGVDFDVRGGEVVTLLGRNGAGKTTTLKSIMGMIDKRTGSITLAGTQLIGLPSNRIARLGIAICPEERGIFASLDVEENLLLPPVVRDGGLSVEAIFELFPNLRERLDSRGTNLSGGEQQMLAIGRILRTGARLLLLDEPTEGLAPVIVQQIGGILRTLKAKGFTILLVEQNFRFAATVADRHYVMEHGRVVDMIPNDQLAANMTKLSSYLGV